MDVKNGFSGVEKSAFCHYCDVKKEVLSFLTSFYREDVRTGPYRILLCRTCLKDMLVSEDPKKLFKFHVFETQDKKE